MTWDYFANTTFVVIILIGAIIATLYAFMRKTKKRRAR